MRAGTLRHRVTIQRSALATADSYGAQSETWTDVETVWAEVRMFTALEGWRVKQIQPEATVQVLMRYQSDLTSADRFLFDSRYLYPLNVVSNIKKTETRCLCSEKL